MRIAFLILLLHFSLININFCQENERYAFSSELKDSLWTFTTVDSFKYSNGNLSIIYYDSTVIENQYFSIHYVGEDFYDQSCILIEKHRYFSHNTYAYRFHYTNGVLINGVMSFLNESRSTNIQFYASGEIYYIVNYYLNGTNEGVYDGDYIMFDKEGNVKEHEFYAKGNLLFKKM